MINFLTICLQGNKESSGYIGFRWLSLNLVRFFFVETTALWPLSRPSFPSLGIYVRDHGYSLRFLLGVWTLCTLWYDVAIIPAQIPFCNPRKENLSLFSPLQKPNWMENSTQEKKIGLRVLYDIHSYRTPDCEVDPEEGHRVVRGLGHLSYEAG